MNPTEASGVAEATGSQLLQEPIKFGTSDGFYAVLRQRINDYFERTGKRRRDCLPMYFKTAVIMTWFVGSYLLLMFYADSWMIALPLSLSIGLAMAAIGFNVQHDGGHRSYSEHPWVNKLAAMSLDLLGGSSFVWARKHNSIHHTYSNITGHDDDIELGGIGRLSPYQPHRPWHRFQHFYLWVLYGFLPTKWQFYDDYNNVLSHRVGVYELAPMRLGDWAVFLCGKFAFYTFAFVLPIYMHGVWNVLGCYAAASMVQGIVLSTVFQLAHCVEGADFPMVEGESHRIARPWAEHQLETTVDFSRTNPFITWLVGGLNFQVEHHLFPQICHVHYPALSAIVEETCREYGVTYKAHGSLWSGIASHFRWLRRMAAPPTAPAAS